MPQRTLGENKMADRRFTQFFYSFGKHPTMLEGSFVVGGTGAVGTTKGMGLASITRLDTGKYRLTFEDAYRRFLAFSHCFVDIVGSTGTSGIMEVAVLGNPDTTLQSKYIDIQMRASGGSAADPAQYLVFYFKATVDNTSTLPSNE